METKSDETEPDRAREEWRRYREEIRELRETGRVREALLDALFESAPEAIALVDGADRVTQANGEFCRLFGYAHDEVAGQLINNLIAPDHLREEALSITRRVTAGERIETETVRRRKDGTEVDVALRAAPVYASGEQIGTYAIYRDTTERRRALEALRDSEEQYRLLFENNPNPMWVYDLETLAFLAVNGAAVRHYGYSRDEFLGMTIRDIRPPEDVPLLRKNIGEAPAEYQCSDTWRHRLRDGSVRDVRITSHPIPFAGRQARLVLVYDVTEWKQAEAARHESQQRYRALFHQSPLGVFLYDRELCLTHCNKRFIDALGIPGEQLIGMDLTTIRERRLLPALRRALEGEAASYEGPYQATSVEMDLWVSVNISPLRDARGEVIGGIGTIENITPRKHGEAKLRVQAEQLERVNAELRRRTEEVEAAMQARNRLYAQMNHEIRTPITAVMLYNELLLGGTLGPLTPEQSAGVRRSQDAAQHLFELVHDILDLSKIEAGKVVLQPAVVNIPDLLDELFATVRPMAESRGSELRVECLGSSCTLVTDPRRLRQILLNLFSNAVKFGRAAPVVVRCMGHPAGGVVIEVIDRGIGIAPDDLQLIFDDFVQVGDPQETGTGLGLAISRRLTELVGGTLQAESVLGEGSTFRLILPPSIPGIAPGDPGERGS